MKLRKRSTVSKAWHTTYSEAVHRIYIARLVTPQYSKAIKMVLLK